MADSDGQEKTEQPTDKKQSDVRDKGQTAKSMEINSLFIFTFGLLILYMSQGFIGSQFRDITVFIFSSLGKLELNTKILQMYALKSFGFYLQTLLPIFGGLFAVAALAGYGQVGFKFTPKALAPKFDKINPIKGLQNTLFSSRPLFETGKNILKLSLIGGFTYMVLVDDIMHSIGLVQLTVPEIVEFMLNTSYALLWKITIIFALIAAADFAYQKFKHKKSLMMSMQEIKEEFKQTEGDPMIKSRIKGQQFAMARKRMMSEVPKADVVITNPTHFAVAIKYEMGAGKAPKVIAKGTDFVAQKIKAIAAENNVPIHEDVALARALYKACDIGDEIPENLYKAVAQILAYIYQLKRTKKKKSIV